ncbi:paraquat-inducible protein A [Pseudomonas oryzihabitans]|uniref:paraquat-inducible protein A n=1 Tax=Pseudomonas oryzihabitans TaxID=47885 RepID=UPI000943174A|nr:paraquat-inducible protein A [Pseudomonas psychrotolerans]NMY91667.1 paraquat-inducible protein A [Pseudomonas psychrotolerans]
MSDQSLPRTSVAAGNRLVICEHCDSVHRLGPLVLGERAHCLRCGALLYRASRLDIQGLLALAIAAAVLFVIANVSPILQLKLSGLHSESTLLGSVMAMRGGFSEVMGLVVAMTLFVVPLLQIVLLLWVLSFAQAGHRAPGFAKAMVTLHYLRPWSMIEVFVLGTLVAMIKLIGLVHVVIGAGLFGMVGLMVVLLIIAKRDLHPLWDAVGERDS